MPIATQARSGDVPIWPDIEAMVGETGFEPATSCSQSRRATGLRHSPTLCCLLEADGGPGRIRTRDLAVMSGQL